MARVSELRSNRTRQACHALVHVGRVFRHVPLLQRIHEKLLERRLAFEEPARTIRLLVAEVPHALGEQVVLQRTKAQWHDEASLVGEAERAFNDAHLPVGAGTHVRHVVVLPDNRHDEHRLVTSGGGLHRHLGNAWKQRMHHVIGPSHGAFRMQQDSSTRDGLLHRIILCGVATVVGNQVVHSPEARRGRDDPAVGPAGHDRRHHRRQLLVHQPIRAELRMVGPDERCGTCIHRAGQSRAVCRW